MPVYLSLGSTIFNTTNTEILITDIRDGIPGNLVCHTDKALCCRKDDTVMGENGKGHWYFPNDTPIRGGLGASPTEPFIRWRDAQAIRLARRENINPLSPTGSYCCIIPTTTGEMKFCANLGKWLIHAFSNHHALLYAWYKFTIQLCVTPSLPLPME